MKTLYGRAALLMAAILLFCIIFTALTGVQVPQKAEGLQVTASFYPLYIAALNVIGQVSGVSVSCLVAPQVGCVHDYQMTPNDRMLLQQTDILLLNGGGAEAFLEGHLSAVTELVRVDTSEGIEFLCAEHDHSDHDHGHTEQSYNEHIWTSPVRYRRQVINLANGLAQADPTNKDAYLANAENYCRQIDQVWERLQKAVKQSGFTKSVIFSTSLVYLAQDLGLQTLAILEIGEESGASAAQLSAAQQAIGGQKVLFLYDAQYEVMYTDLQRLAAESRIVLIDTAVSGKMQADAWLQAMRQTADLFEKQKGEDGL